MLTGSLWKSVAITEAVLILAAVGFGAGLIIRPHLNDLAKSRGSAQAGHPTGGVKGTSLPGTGGQATSSPTATASASAQPSQVVELSLREAEARTGVSYSGSGCASGQKCFSAARETDGDSAAYVQLAAQGYGTARLCYVYLAQAGGWSVVSMACGSAPGFAPAVNSTVTIRAPGSCGRLRARAGLQGAVVRCLANGSSAQVTSGPMNADGQLWWQASASGVTGVLAQDLIVDPAAIVPPKS